MKCKLKTTSLLILEQHSSQPVRFEGKFLLGLGLQSGLCPSSLIFIVLGKELKMDRGLD